MSLRKGGPNIETMKASRSDVCQIVTGVAKLLLLEWQANIVVVQTPSWDQYAYELLSTAFGAFKKLEIITSTDWVDETPIDALVVARSLLEGLLALLSGGGEPSNNQRVLRLVRGELPPFFKDALGEDKCNAVIKILSSSTILDLAKTATDSAVRLVAEKNLQVQN